MTDCRRALVAYGSVLRRPGVAIPAMGTALASLPIGMLSLAMLLLVQATATGFSAAGVVVGMLGLGTGAGIAVQGRLMDRFGHTPVLLGAICVQAPALIGMVIIARLTGATWLLAGLAFLAGAGEPQVGGSLRALWTILVPAHDRPTAVALSSILFELPVVLGPLLLFVLLTFTNAAIVVLIACACFIIGAGLLATSRAARSWRPASPPQRSLLGPLASPGVRLVTTVAISQGLVTGLLQVSCAAFTHQRVTPGAAAILYALLSAGSLLGTVIYGARHWPGNAPAQLATLLGLLAVVFAAAAVATSVALLGSTVFAAGLLLGPIAVCCFTEAEHHAPAGALVAAFTTLTATGLAAGAAGSALAGWIIDHNGTTAALATAAAVTLAIGLGLLARAGIAQRGG